MTPPEPDAIGIICRRCHTTARSVKSTSTPPPQQRPTVQTKAIFPDQSKNGSAISLHCYTQTTFRVAPGRNTNEITDSHERIWPAHNGSETIKVRRRIRNECQRFESSKSDVAMRINVGTVPATSLHPVPIVRDGPAISAMARTNNSFARSHRAVDRKDRWNIYLDLK